MATWIKETDRAIYLMEGNYYLEKLSKVRRPNGESQLDVTAIKRWFARPDAPGGMVVAVGIGAAEPQPKPSPKPPKPKVKQVPASAANYRARRSGFDIDTIVIHNTVGSTESSIAQFQNSATKVSAHYIIDRSGEIIQMVDDRNCAYHAGDKDMNDRSIGIEHEATETLRGLTPAQSKASIALIRFLMDAYKIPRSRIIPHRVIASTACPSLIFPDNAAFQKWVQSNF